MTTPRDLMTIAVEVAPRRPVQRGDLSLALAGAELIDLLAVRAFSLDDDHIVPGDRSAMADRLPRQQPPGASLSVTKCQRS
jgi:hypothetical protein